jgi:hypothetical protein
MSPLYAAVALVWILVLIAGRMMPAAPLAAASPDRHAYPPISATVSKEVARELPRVANDREGSEPAFDLYGNEIESAVADYRVDTRGGIYELHSPDTAVERLGPPGT